MKKQEFLEALRRALCGLPERDIEERLGFYAEMIDDRVEEGMDEEAAVAAIGTVEEVASQIVAETPLVKLARERLRPKRRFATWEIVLLALGAPIWLSLAIAALSVALSLYAVLWSLVISAWAIFASFAACAAAGVLTGPIFALGAQTLAGLCLLAAGICLCGLAIFAYFGCKAATRGTVVLSAKIALGAKRAFVKKEGEQ